ncbi:hypothetical protein QNH47_06205 [Virgibacillus halodenitrificans]|uniref:hypothetical protein n=1 Tax=Virgibacillus halodenitrificans TaxID=1482 RepID=UPI0024C05894|nr:hypothetical protein [Virgibacillus halodenitrificans]WHX27445.1 hypothetical protein QNH47_06205 [Virgibacillus halodenitrificans]
MANVQIEITIRNHGGESVLRPAYRALNANITYIGGGSVSVNDLTGINPVDFTGKALDKVVASIVSNGSEPADVAITMPAEIVLSAGLKTHITDKYNADPAINSITIS